MSVLTEQALKKMKVPELKAELKLRKLKVSGKKEELIQRLLTAQSEGVVPSALDDDAPSPKLSASSNALASSSSKPAQTTSKRKAESTEPEQKVDAKKKKPEPKEEISEDESEEDDGEGSKDDYKDEGGDDEDDDEEDDDEASDEVIKPLTASGWGKILEEEIKKKYFKQIILFVNKERKNLKIYPPQNLVFNAFYLTPLEEVKVVILGQDPYIKEGEAHGLCFSVPRGVTVPPSLKRIFKALESTVPGFKTPNHGCLEEWARRGVLLLNATLTVQKGNSNSHENCGWQEFTDNVIKIICKHRKGLIFFLWGGFAQKKSKIINSKEHIVLKCKHPSPMSGSTWECDHFVRSNEILKEQGKDPIDWTLSK